jgi:hypothetical protein
LPNYTMQDIDERSAIILFRGELTGLTLDITNVD